MDDIPKFTKKNIGQCWNCKYQTGESAENVKGNLFSFPYCQHFRMTMNAIFIKECEWHEERKP